MKNSIRNSVLSLFLIGGSMAWAGIPAVNVTVSDSGGKAAFKGATNSTGGFATANLKPGNYVVQFNSSNAALKGKHYALVVSAGKKKVSASAVPGEKFANGGVAMKVDVTAGLNITGQVAAESDGTVNKDGKKMVWIPPMLGSNLPGHWAEEGSAEEIASRTRGNVRKDRVNEMQNKGIGMPGS
jgi:hypothetical protein